MTIAAVYPIVPMSTIRHLQQLKMFTRGRESCHSAYQPATNMSHVRVQLALQQIAEYGRAVALEPENRMAIGTPQGMARSDRSVLEVLLCRIIGRDGIQHTSGSCATGRVLATSHATPLTLPGLPGSISQNVT